MAVGRTAATAEAACEGRMPEFGLARMPTRGRHARQAHRQTAVADTRRWGGWAAAAAWLALRHGGAFSQDPASGSSKGSLRPPSGIVPIVLGDFV